MDELGSASGRVGTVEWAVAGRPLRGQHVSGDTHVALARPGGVLLGVIDGLGHGAEAATAARGAVEVLTAHATEPVEALVRRCSDALHATRGVAMSLAAVDERAETLEWLGVGNVEGALLREGMASTDDEALLLRGGVVGYRLPPLRPARQPLRPGDTLVMATDGLEPAFMHPPDRLTGPVALAGRMLERHGRPADDALVLVARYRPPAS